VAKGYHLGLSPQQVARALRYFVIMGALWAIYGPNCTVAGPVLSGFCLKVGLSDSQIAFLVSLTGLMGASQLLSYFLTRRARDKRRMMVGVGVWEITFVSLVVLAGIKLPPPYRFYGIAGLLVLGFLFGHAVSPAWNSWMSNIIPPEVRSAYIGRRMVILSAVGIVYLFVASRLLDILAFPLNFLVVFGIGWVGGIGGYVVAWLTPYPRVEEAGGYSLRDLLRPLRERAFVRLMLFAAAWLTASMMASAFYNVYMLSENYLHLSYSTVALFTNIALLMTIVGYQVSGSLAQRFGSKPVIELLVVPAAAVPLMWMLTTSHNYSLMIPIASVISGLCSAGIFVAMSSLLYKIVPQGREVPEYFVLWAAISTIGTALGPLISGVLRSSFSSWQLSILGMQFSGMQLVFAVATMTMLLPIVLSYMLEETEAASPMYVLGQFRGNLFSLAYNFALYATAKEDEKRADTLRALGRSHSPLAVGVLLRGLQDSSPTVRQSALEALGESRLDEGLGPLVDALDDEELDIRVAAAEALGKLRKPAGVAPLIKRLHSDDLHLRNSAALALGEIGGPEACEALYQALQEPFDKHTFPTLVDAASRTGDLRIVTPALQRLPMLQSPVLRMQVLNAVGRVLGERNHFYRLRVADKLGRAALVERMMARIVRLLKTVKLGTPQQRQQMKALARQIAAATANGDTAALRSLCEELASVVLSIPDALPVVYAGAHGMLMYLQEIDETRLEDEGLVFLTVALTSIARHLAVGGNKAEPAAEGGGA